MQLSTKQWTGHVTSLVVNIVKIKFSNSYARQIEAKKKNWSQREEMAFSQIFIETEDRQGEIK